MRKRLQLCAWGAAGLLACSAVPAGEGARLEAESRIEQVLLYSSGAAVRRRAELKLGAGRSTVVMAGLPPALVRGSLRARLAGPAGLRLLAVNYRLEPRRAPQRAEEEQLLAGLNALDARLKGLNDERGVLAAQAEALRGLALLPPAAVREGGSKPAEAEPPPLAVEAWGRVLDFSQGNLGRTLARLRELNEAAGRLELEIRTRQEALDKLRSQRIPAVATAFLDVESPAAGDARIALTYDVANVAWYPTGSFKVDPAAGTAELVRYAACAQNTGEDWSNVEMVFSTGEAQRVAVLPELKTWQIVEAVAGGALEPPAAGQEEPGEEVIARPGELPAVPGYEMASPLAVLGFLGAGRLRDAYGYQGLGSLGEANEMLDAISDIPLGDKWPSRKVMGVGGGGVAGVFGYRDGGGRKKSVGRFGGSEASESCIEAGFSWLAKSQQANGSWSSQSLGGTARMDEADTALAVLSFLGAGYTESSGKYKEKVSAALAWLIAKQSGDGSIGGDLWTRALAATALSEAYGMDRNVATGRAAQRAVSALAREVGSSPWPLQQGLSGKSWPDGPSNLALVALALKSGKIAGLAVDQGAVLQVMSMLDDLEKAPPSPLNAAAAMMIRQTLGYSPRDEDNLRDARTIIANLPRWEPGQIDFRYLYFGTMAMFQMGGEHWSKWNHAVRDMLIERQGRKGEDDGSWPPADACGASGGMPHAGASRVYATAMASMCLEVYYRYLPMYGGAGGGGSGSGAGARGTGEPSQFIPPIISAAGRDFRARAIQPESLPSDGAFKLVAVERRKLEPVIRHVAVPVKYRGAFLQAEAVNASTEPLLAGEARLFLGADYIGAVFMKTVPAGGKFTIPLGLDPDIKLSRLSRSERKEAGFRNRLRQTTYTVTLEAANHKPRPVDLVLIDRVPRPEDARIRIAEVKFSGAKPEYDPEGDTGQVTFTVRLKPGEVRAVGLSYVVEHPADLEAVQERGRP